MRLFCCIILILSTASVSQAQTDISTKGHCSPIYIQNKGKINFNCNVNIGTNPKLEEQVNNIQKKLQDELTSRKALRNDLSRLKLMLETATKDLSQVNTLQNQYEHLSGAYITSVEKNRSNLEALVEGLSNLSKEFDLEFENLQEQVIDKIEQSNTSTYNKISAELFSVGLQLQHLERRVLKLENDVSFLMTEVLEGNLDRNLYFFGVSVGGVYIDQEWCSRIAGEFEIIASNFFLLERTSLFIEISRLSWKKKTDYLTLPGLAERVVVDNHDTTYMGVGLRWYPFSKDEKFLFSMNAAVGHSIAGAENTFYFYPGISCELAKRSLRLIFDIRWEAFSSINESEVEFNLFGDSQLKTKEEFSNGIYLGCRIMFR